MSEYRQPILNRWHFEFYYGPYFANHGRLFTFGLYKLIERPPEGTKITKEYYKGFLIWREWVPKFNFGISYNFPEKHICHDNCYIHNTKLTDYTSTSKK